ncbi:phosphotransferase enzyme family protein [Neobacillus sp. D3-1R]|uniref:phosphotransferase enzyme family protein n=1 Tax=Neobacillus sp. D3-1R TaxID=3445778 RepID=UPI003F9FFF5B
MIENNLVESAISFWGSNGSDFLKLTGGFQNDVYEYKQGKKKRILRISNSKQLSHVDLTIGEMEYIEMLAERGISVSRPLLSMHGKYIEKIKWNHNTYLVASFSYAKGNPIMVSNPNEWNESFFQHWGRTMGKMHSISKEHDCRIIQRPAWSPVSPDIRKIADFLSSVSEEATNSFEKLVKMIQALPRELDTYGLIHSDFHQGNFFVQDGQMTIFDFADCTYNWYAHDIAVSFYHAAWQGMSFNPDDTYFPVKFLHSFFEGYRQENVLNRVILIQIPLFLKFREFFLYTLFNEKWDMEHLEDWQIYTLSNLKERIEREIPYLDISFESFL